MSFLFLDGTYIAKCYVKECQKNGNDKGDREKSIEGM